jgi:hypothetical protein
MSGRDGLAVHEGAAQQTAPGEAAMLWSFEHRCKRSEGCRLKENFVPLALRLYQPDLFAERCGHGLIALAETRGRHLVLAAHHHGDVGSIRPPYDLLDGRERVDRALEHRLVRALEHMLPPLLHVTRAGPQQRRVDHFGMPAENVRRDDGSSRMASDDKTVAFRR